MGKCRVKERYSFFKSVTVLPPKEESKAEVPPPAEDIVKNATDASPRAIEEKPKDDKPEVEPGKVKDEAGKEKETKVVTTPAEDAELCYK